MTASLDLADDLIAFVNAAPTPWHAVDEAVRRLEARGYRRLDEGESWRVRAGDRVYVVRGGATIAALEIGDAPPDATGFRLVGAHTDSPNLRLKPNAVVRRHGHVQLSVEIYGGVLLHTWLDRDLGLSGRVMVRTPEGIAPRLVRLDEALMRIPSLAIHLNRQVNTDGLVLNPQTHMPPLVALDTGAGAFDLHGRLAAAISTPHETWSAGDVLAFDLCAHDVVPAARGGAAREYVFAPRLDNLANCHAALAALLDAPPAPHTTRGVFLFDHEECGSQSAQGAQGTFLRDVLTRIADAFDGASRDALPRAVHRSFFVSADMAHALHPNFADKHEPNHQPLMGGGPVVKSNVNQRYATDAEGQARFEAWCGEAGVPSQRFVTRTDLGCGSTIGPITASGLGLRVVDVGNPMMSMHSCREMTGAADVPHMVGALRAFFTSSR